VYSIVPSPKQVKVAAPVANKKLWLPKMLETPLVKEIERDNE
jgi:hypothetical protein